MKTRLRRLQVDGRSCTWTARICHVPLDDDCHRGIRLRIWGAGKNSRLLQVDLLSKTEPGPWGACATDDAYPASQDVRTIIDYAPTHGWQPDTLGGTFHLTESHHAPTLELPNFLITDTPGRRTRAASPLPRELPLGSGSWLSTARAGRASASRCRVFRVPRGSKSSGRVAAIGGGSPTIGKARAGRRVGLVPQ